MKSKSSAGLFVMMLLVSLPVSTFLIVKNVAGNQLDQYSYLPLLTKPLCRPALISPEEGAILDNGDNGSIIWEFQWSECSGAMQYHLYVIGPHASIPIIDDFTSNTSYTEESIGSYIAEFNRFGWTWKVRAYHSNGEWGPWSVARTFDVEPY